MFPSPQSPRSGRHGTAPLGLDAATVTFEEGTKKTIDWYLEQTKWLGHVVSGQYQQYYKDKYSNR